MAMLSASIEADVPIGFADEEWTEFLWRSMYGSFHRGTGDDAGTLPDIEADSGTVEFEEADGRLVKVSVRVKFRPQAHADRHEQIGLAQARLERDLGRFRTFLLRRCEQEHCRAA